MSITSHEYYLKKIQQFKDVEDRIFDRPALPADIQKIHITAVCGKAMAPLAGLLVARGYTVTGSDKGCFPPMSHVLQKLGIESKPFDAQNVIDADVVVIGNACTPSNPEAMYCREQNIPQLSISEALQQFIMHDRIRLVVAGTHGKTTTTGLLAHIFEVAEKDPGFSVGGTMQEKDETYALGTGPHFIIEGDEYNTSYFDKGPKFLAYEAHGAIVTSVEYDHVDIYDDFSDYMQAFRFFVQGMPSDGHVMLWGDDEHVRSLQNDTDAHVHTYGFDEKNEYRILDVVQGDGVQSFNLYKGKTLLGTFETPMPGRHNILNITGAVGLAYEYGISCEDIQKAVVTFKGMVKRQEVLASDPVLVIDDYAHHPTSVRMTLQALKLHYPNRKTLVLFEPNSNTCRRNIFEKEFAEALTEADSIFVKQPERKESDKDETFISTERIVAMLQEKGEQAQNFTDNEAMVDALYKEVQKGDMIVVMTNTSFDDVQGMVLARVQHMA